jgi:iron complex outermembrane receptor protein
MWKPTERQTVWGAISYAVRTPSQALEDATLHQAVSTPLGTAVAEVLGNHGIDSEELLAYELGYRAQPIQQFSLDIATFYNVYDQLRSAEPIPPPGFPVVAAFQFENKLDAESYGVEAAGHWLVTDWWRIDALYSFIRIFAHTTDGGVDKDGEHDYEGATPQNQVVVRSSMDLPRNLQLDFAFRYVDALAQPDVPSYFVMDTRLTWWPKRNLELSVVGQNLFDNRHLEFGPSFIQIAPTEVPHGVYGKVTWSY